MIPRLAGWDWDSLDPEIRKSFEIALHAGAAMALMLTRRAEIADEIRGFDSRRAIVLLLSFLPAALAGYRFERLIEARLGGPLSTAAGLIGGAALMALADQCPQQRGRGDALPADGLALGLAQAAALMPGVSRNGATLTAARMRRFSRDQANLLSRTVALPVILGAVALKGSRLASRGISRKQGKWLAVGVATSFASTLASNRLIGMVERDRALLPYSAYRIAFGLLILGRLASSGRSVVESEPMINPGDQK